MHQLNADSAIAKRLERLERQNARLRFMGVVVLAVIAIGAIAGAIAPASKTLEVQRLVIVDDSGKHLAELGVPPDGTGISLSLFDKQEKKRLQLGVNEQDAGLSLIQGGELRAALNARVGQHAMLLIQKEKFDNKKNQMGFGFMDDGKPHIFINDGEAKTILSQP